MIAPFHPGDYVTARGHEVHVGDVIVVMTPQRVVHGECVVLELRPRHHGDVGDVLVIDTVGNKLTTNAFCVEPDGDVTKRRPYRFGVLQVNIGTRVAVKGDNPGGIAAVGEVIGHGHAMQRDYYDIDDVWHPAEMGPVVLVRLDHGNHLNPAIYVDVLACHPDNIEPEATMYDEQKAA